LPIKIAMGLMISKSLIPVVINKSLIIMVLLTNLWKSVER